MNTKLRFQAGPGPIISLVRQGPCLNPAAALWPSQQIQPYVLDNIISRYDRGRYRSSVIFIIMKMTKILSQDTTRLT